jgi:hypothetical protein
MGFVYNLVSQYIPMIRKKPPLSRDQALRTRPIHNPVLEWEKDANGEVVLRIPQRRDMIGKILCKVFRAPGHRVLALDKVGSDIWELCDGDNSVEAIVAIMCKKYKITRRECETSVGTYLKTLSDRNLVGFQAGGRKKK